MQRLDAEIVRDSILAVSGGLNLQMDGPPVFPMIPDEVVKSMFYGTGIRRTMVPRSGGAAFIFIAIAGCLSPCSMSSICPIQNISCGARNITTVPTQALTLMNDDFVLKQAQLFANRLEEAAPGDARSRSNWLIASHWRARLDPGNSGLRKIS